MLRVLPLAVLSAVADPQIRPNPRNLWFPRRPARATPASLFVSVVPFVIVPRHARHPHCSSCSSVSPFVPFLIPPRPLPPLFERAGDLQAK